MTNFILAKLVDWRTINIVFFADLPPHEPLNISLYKNETLIEQVAIAPSEITVRDFCYQLKLFEDYDLDAKYHLIVGSFPSLLIDNSMAIDFHNFDERYAYDGDDLGAIYCPKQTVFKLWAPLASSVIIKIIATDGKSFSRVMKRESKGIYTYIFEGDLLNYKYRYVITNNGVTRVANDPYGKAVSLNSEYSVVVDYVRLLDIPNVHPITEIKHHVDAIIYETHIRDINEGNFNDVVNKGKYLGFVETGRKTKGGNPAGLDYIKYLGVTHIQIQPIFDFKSVDDINTSNWYNWGYDPLSFFALEGSYSLKPEVAMERLYEFKEMVNKLHENDLRLIVDVVYNHVYQYEDSDLEKIVPHYYFRKNKSCQLTNHSGCGNDFASERKMARKLIIDSVKYLFAYFDIDGLRLDLMGLLDLTTVKAIYQEAKALKSSVIILGEGWQMGESSQQKDFANKGNALALPEIAFFNDAYRDIIKGPSMHNNLIEKGYICGNVDYVYGVDYAFHASVLNLSYQPVFKTANQSVNYLECHDNATLYDKLLVSNASEDEVSLLERVSLANSILLLSFGIPFIHMGQEIGLSKEGLDNTYKTLRVNNLDYRLVDQRFDMVNRFRLFNILRKKLAYPKLFAKEELTNFFEIAHWQNGIYALTAKNKNVIAEEKEFVILINPTSRNITFELPEYYAVVEGAINSQELNVKNGFLPKSSILLLFLKE